MNNNLLKAVSNAINLYAEMFGVTPAEVGRLFRENQSTRESVILLVALQSDISPLAK